MGCETCVFSGSCLETEVSKQLYYRISLDLSKDNPAAYYGIGICHVQKKDMKAALANWEKCIEIDPEYVGAVHNLAMGYQELGDDKKAHEYYTRCIELRPEEALFYFERGYLQINTDHGKGLNDLSKAIELAPDYAAAYWTRGLIYKMFYGDNAKAEDDYNMATKIDPRYKERPYQ